jgi:hypothetical protein
MVASDTLTALPPFPWITRLPATVRGRAGPELRLSPAAKVMAMLPVTPLMVSGVPTGLPLIDAEASVMTISWAMGWLMLNALWATVSVIIRLPPTSAAVTPDGVRRLSNNSSVGRMRRVFMSIASQRVG